MSTLFLICAAVLAFGLYYLFNSSDTSEQLVKKLEISRTSNHIFSKLLTPRHKRRINVQETPKLPVRPSFRSFNKETVSYRPEASLYETPRNKTKVFVIDCAQEKENLNSIPEEPICKPSKQSEKERNWFIFTPAMSNKLMN